jgi:peptidoglycan/xylan/chitin deacetylase (PgdA/CDA1 family)
MRKSKKSILALAITLIMVASLLPMSNLVNAEEPAKTVYVVICVDTENAKGHDGVEIGSTDPNPTFDMSEYEPIPTERMAQVFDSSFRWGHLDSYGNPFKLTWFCEMDYVFSQAQFIYDDGSSPGVSGYTATKDLLVNNWGSQIQEFGDSVEYHHHFEIFDQTWQQYENGPDENYPNYQNIALDHMIIDRGYFPSCFRSGWDIDPPALENWIEQWFPFDYVPLGANTFPYQTEGMHHWIQMVGAGIDPANINATFSAADQEGTAIYSFNIHDNEGMASQISLLQDYLANEEVSFPDVAFRYVTARQAMQLALGYTDTSTPVFTVTSNNDIYTISSSEPLWDNHPYVALKYQNGTYMEADATLVGDNTWTVTPPNNGLLTLGVAANDLYGNPGVWVDSAQAHGVISLTFDDGWENQYTNAYPLMQARAITGTFYVITSQIGNSDHMTYAELQDLQSHGSEIGSHSATHPDLTQLSDEQIQQECASSKDALQANGLVVNNFAYPWGSYDWHTDSIVSQYYRTGRNVYCSGDVVQLPFYDFDLPANEGDAGGYGVLSTLKSIVDKVYSTNDWAVIYFHQILPNVSNSPEVLNTDTFTSFLDYIQSKGIPTVTVNQALSLTAPPVPAPSVTVTSTATRLEIGQSTTFNCAVSGGNQPFSHQWYLNGAAVPDSTDSTWTFTPNNSGTYQVYDKVTDGLNNVVQSNTDSITVYAHPTVTITPNSAKMHVGESQTLSSSISNGYPPYTYQWFSNNSAIPNETNPTLNYVPNQPGTYNIYLRITDHANYQAKSNTATITVYSQPSATIIPSAANITPNSTQRFTSTASGGSTPYSYQWYLNQSQIQNANSNFWDFTPNSAGIYLIYLRVTDSLLETIQSNTATVKVDTQMNITINPTQASLYVNQTQKFNSSVAGGTSPYSYQWYLNGTAITGATNQNWTFTPTLAGFYRLYLTITDALNITSQSSNIANITVFQPVNQPLNVTISPTFVNITIGASQTFYANISGGIEPYSYQWYLNSTLIPGATNSTWIFNATSTGTYIIYLVVKDSNNSNAVSNNSTATVRTPIITLTSVTLLSGGSGYTTPAILFIGGGGTGATATARVSNGEIFGIVITNPGSGYTSPPTISIRDPSPRAEGANATANLGYL